MPADDNYSVRDYGRMLADTARTRPYEDALKRAVRPGSIVLDIGTGPGYFALLACQCGAARVYACETDATIDIGRESAQRAGVADRIVWLRRLSTEIDLPERVDVVLGDLHGILPFYTGNLTSLIDARRRHLRPGGTMIPLRDTVFAVPAEAADEYADLVRPWEHNDSGVDLSAGRRYVANQWWRAASPPIAAARFLAAPRSWVTLDYSRCDSPSVSGQCEWIAERAGTLHGYYVWFDSETAEGLRLSNAPTLPELVYGRAFFPLEQPQDLQPGARIHAEFGAHLVSGDYILRWNTRIDHADGQVIARYAQSSFASRPVLKEDLARARPEHRPVLSEAARIELTVLHGMAQGESLAQIAGRLAREFPARYADPPAALRRATELARRFEQE